MVNTKLPSFIITLAMLFIVRGAAQGVLRMLTGTSTIDGVREAVGAGGFSQPVLCLGRAVLGFARLVGRADPDRRLDPRPDPLSATGYLRPAAIRPRRCASAFPSTA